MYIVQGHLVLAMNTPVADRVSQCEEAFHKAKSTIADCSPSSEDGQKSLSHSIDDLNEQYERFQLWSNNGSAYRQGPSSLDNQLREHAKLQSVVLQYLDDMKCGLEDIIDIITRKVTPWDGFSDSSEEETFSGDTENEGTELTQLKNYVKNSITCLMRMPVIIQDPGPREGFVKTDKVDQSFHQEWDERHVSEKFANIPRWMVVRLGSANTWRRQLLENHKSRSRVMKNQHYFLDEENGPGSSVMIKTSSREHSNQPARPKEPYLADDSYDGETVTSYAETVPDEDTLSIPPMPDQAKEGALFECPFCFMTISEIHDRMEWKRHVFTDLQPYNCLFQDCVSAHRTFARRNSWIMHEKQFHRTGWRCSMGCNMDFSSKRDIHNHFVKVHSLTNLLESQVNALAVQCQSETPGVLQCPLCQENINTLDLYYKHVSKHLEQLALFALPKETLDEVYENDPKQDKKLDLTNKEMSEQSESSKEESGFKFADKEAPEIDSISIEHIILEFPDRMRVLSTETAGRSRGLLLRESLYVCGCGDTIQSISDFERHNKYCKVSLDKQGKYPCELCGKRFARKDNLDRHRALFKRRNFGCSGRINDSEPPQPPQPEEGHRN